MWTEELRSIRALHQGYRTAFLGAIASAGALLMVTGGCEFGRGDLRNISQTENSPANARAEGELLAETVSTIEAFCGDCHALPIPSTFPKQSWEDEVIRGFDFYIKSGRTDLKEPSRDDVIRYYTSQAPDKLAIPRASDFPQSKPSVRFTRAYEGNTALETPVSYAHIVATEVAGQWLAADMRQGPIHRWTFDSSGQWKVRQVASGQHACRLTPCNWDNDEYPDYLLGEIGSYGVGDHTNGRVSLLLGKPNGEFEHILLAEGLGRVVEAQPIDFDLDGDLDVLVAEFGYLETGSLKLLRNEGTSDNKPIMKVEVIDSRHGALGVRVADVDGDGTVDFVTAYGQEFETIEVYFGNGKGDYRREVIHSLPDPSYNSSSFELADMDGDGRIDIIHTNGDTLDTFMAKPYHGVRWIRNLGSSGWEPHELGFLVGALHCAVADFDGDGDLDIAAVGMFPFALKEGVGHYDSACWWEQREGGSFVRHSIEKDNCNYVCCIATDVNQDGRVDLMFGNWNAEAGQDSFVVFLNQPQ